MCFCLLVLPGEALCLGPPTCGIPSLDLVPPRVCACACTHLLQSWDCVSAGRRACQRAGPCTACLQSPDWRLCPGELGLGAPSGPRGLGCGPATSSGLQKTLTCPHSLLARRLLLTQAGQQKCPESTRVQDKEPAGLPVPSRGGRVYLPAQ